MKKTINQKQNDKILLEGLCIFAKARIDEIKNYIDKKYHGEANELLDAVYALANGLLKDLKKADRIHILIENEND